MRIYAPTETTAVLADLLEEPSLSRGVVHHAVLPPREARFEAFPAWLDPRIVAGLGTRGIERPYTHQAEAIEATRAGQDIVVVTPTILPLSTSSFATSPWRSDSRSCCSRRYFISSR